MAMALHGLGQLDAVFPPTAELFVPGIKALPPDFVAELFQVGDPPASEQAIRRYKE